MDFGLFPFSYNSKIIVSIITEEKMKSKIYHPDSNNIEIYLMLVGEY